MDAYTVKDLTRMIKRCIEKSSHLQDVWVRGEISNFTHHSRGHMYFTLKDEQTQIRTVMFSSRNRYLKFIPKSGLTVLARGEVNVYERSGQYQLYVQEMQPDGIGALYQAYEDLKQKLEQLGWFAADQKKPIPSFPERIGIITSPTGAAVRDIITTVKRRFPIASITIIPVLVQGDQAATSISQAIKLAHRNQGFDVLIVGRGGGSIEELWAFNEWIVAEAIFTSSIPIISAVGHETDFTIADFTADLRAPTPTAAAELAVPVLSELQNQTRRHQERLQLALRNFIQAQRKDVDRLRTHNAFDLPRKLVVQKEQELDQLFIHLERNLERMLDQQKQDYAQLNHRLSRLNPYSQWSQAKKEHRRLHDRLEREIRLLLQEKGKDVAHRMAQLDAYSPLKIMNKGYSLLYNQDNELVQSVQQVEPGDASRVVMHDGELDVQVWGIKESVRGGANHE